MNQVNKMSKKRALHILKTALWIFVSLFVMVQGVLVLGVLFAGLDPLNYEIQLIVITGFLILLLNISMIVFYCKYAGMPYISHAHYKNVVHVGLVALYWTFAFLVKLASSPF